MVTVDQTNIEFFSELESTFQVTYIPGGAIQNTLRVCSWCLNMEPSNQNKYSITMLGATGDDTNRKKIVKALKKEKIKPLLQAIPNMNTSRCGVGIYKKEKCLLPDIKTSNCLTEEFISEHEKEIFKNDALLIEGYFLKERFDICKHLCMEFTKESKFIILTLNAEFIIQKHYDEILEIAKLSDMIVGNMEEFEALAGTKKIEKKETIFEHVFRKLTEKERLIVVTDGSKGSFISKYDYKRNKIDFISQSYPCILQSDEIKDLNGAGDAFLGGFLSQFMKGSSLYSCCRAGNDAAYVILQNIGCSFPEDHKIDFDL